MTSIANVIERLRRTWLEPPDYQPAGTLLSTSIAAGAQSLTLDSFMIPEDEQLARVGSVIEIGSELFRITQYDSSTRDCVVTPGEYGTTEAAHTAGDFVRLAPWAPRLSVFEAVADNIIHLYPRLFTVDIELVVPVTLGVAPLNDPLAVEVVSVWPEGWTDTYEISGHIVEYHPQAGGRAIILQGGFTGEAWVRYKKRMGKATLETDLLANLGVDDRWVNIVMAGAAADVFVGRDLPASLTEWVGAALQAENIPPGTRYQIAAGLRSYRDKLIKEAEREMKSEYKTKVHMRSPFGG